MCIPHTQIRMIIVSTIESVRERRPQQHLKRQILKENTWGKKYRGKIGIVGIGLEALPKYWIAQSNRKIEGRERSWEGGTWFVIC